MVLSPLNDDEIRDILSQAATNIAKALQFTETLAGGFIYFPKDHDARSQLIESSLSMQATLADQLDMMRSALETSERKIFAPKASELH
jgi:hypothetical protein